MRNKVILISMLLLQSFLYAQLSFDDIKNAKSTHLDFGFKLSTPFPFIHKSLTGGNVNQLRLKDFYVDNESKFLRSNPFTQPFTHSNSLIGMYLKLYNIKGREREGVSYLFDVNYGNRLWQIKNNLIDVVLSSKTLNTNLGIGYSFRKIEKSSNFGINLTGGFDYLFSSKTYTNKKTASKSIYKEIMSSEKIVNFLPTATGGFYWEFSPGGSRITNDGLLMRSTFRYSIGINYTHYFASVLKDNSIGNPGFLSISIKSTLNTPFTISKN